MLNRCSMSFVWVDCRGLSVWALVFHTLCMHTMCLSINKLWLCLKLNALLFVLFSIHFPDKMRAFSVIASLSITLLLFCRSCPAIDPVQMESPAMKMASQMAKIQVSLHVQSFCLGHIIGDNRVSLYKGRVSCVTYRKK